MGQHWRSRHQPPIHIGAAQPATPIRGLEWAPRRGRFAPLHAGRARGLVALALSWAPIIGGFVALGLVKRWCGL